MSRKLFLNILSWKLVVIVTALAAIVWYGERYEDSVVTMYEFFPLLGITAFSLMWTHYIVGSVRRLLGIGKEVGKTYRSITSIIVLLLILLHPGLLILKLNKDGLGLPPKSYLDVYGSTQSLKFALLMGSIALIIFLAFESKRIFSKKTWWRFIDYAQVLAMALIFYHGLTLGRELSVGWYKAVWFFYGLSFIAATTYNYWYDSKVNKNQQLSKGV